MTATNPYIPQPDDQHTSTQYGSSEQPQQAQQTYGQYQGQPYTDGGQTPPEQPAYGAPYTQQPYNAQYGASYNAPYTAPYAQGYYYGQPTQVDRWNGLCIAGFVCAFVIPPVGLILSIIALVQINKSHEKSKGLSIAGIVISALGTLLYVAVIALAIWAVGFTVDYVEEHPEVWFDSDDYSHLDGQLCLPDGTCVDTQDLPDDYDWSDLLYDSAPTDVTEWSDQWQTAQGSAPITMELVD